jgi:arylformamidase
MLEHCMPLDLQDDPDTQMPMPFAAADDYARQVMAWSRGLDTTGMQVMRNLAYGPHRLHRLDIFTPEDVFNQANFAPIVVFWHGGGWTNGYRGYNDFLAPLVTKLGCILVSPSYRLVGEAKFPAALDDARAALDFVAQNATQWGGSARRIILAGHSAGGHIAAYTALRGQHMGLAVHACLPISGIMDLHHPAPVPGSLEERVYTMVLHAPDDDALYSPISWTAANQVPCVLTVGERDSERVRRSNARMARLLAQGDTPASLLMLPQADHFATHMGLRQSGDPWWGVLKSFL